MRSEVETTFASACSRESQLPGVMLNVTADAPGAPTRLADPPYTVVLKNLGHPCGAKLARGRNVDFACSRSSLFDTASANSRTRFLTAFRTSTRLTEEPK